MGQHRLMLKSLYLGLTQANQKEELFFSFHREAGPQILFDNYASNNLNVPCHVIKIASKDSSVLAKSLKNDQTYKN